MRWRLGWDGSGGCQNILIQETVFIWVIYIIYWRVCIRNVAVCIYDSSYFINFFIFSILLRDIFSFVRNLMMYIWRRYIWVAFNRQHHSGILLLAYLIWKQIEIFGKIQSKVGLRSVAIPNLETWYKEVALAHHFFFLSSLNEKGKVIGICNSGWIKVFEKIYILDW